MKELGERLKRRVGPATVAQVLLDVCRGDDLVCRYGGEEFLVLLPGSDAATAHRVAERLRKWAEAES